MRVKRMDYKECDINKDGGRKEKKKKRGVSVINKHSSNACVRLRTSKSPFNLACNMYRDSRSVVHYAAFDW